MSNHWYRWHIGTCEDGKFRMIARNAKVTIGNAIALWSVLLEDASHLDHRGICVRGEDFYGAILDLEFEEVVAILSEMERVDMISVGHGAITITNWDKRQFESDAKDPTNAERQRRYKERKKQTAIDTIGNGAVTEEKLPDTDTDTEYSVPKGTSYDVPLPESKFSVAKPKPTKAKAPYTPEFENFWAHYPLKENKQDAARAFQKITEEIDHDSIARTVQLYTEHAQKLGRHYCHAATWINERRFENDYTALLAEAGPVAGGNSGGYAKRAVGAMEQPTHADRANAATLRAAIKGGYANPEQRRAWDESANHGTTAEQRSLWAVTAGRNAQPMFSSIETLRQATGESGGHDRLASTAIGEIPLLAH